MDEAPNLRWCSACDQLLPVDQFHRQRAGFYPWCKSCRKAYDAAYEKRRRPIRRLQERARIAAAVEWMRQAKSGPCTDCGQRFHPAAMAFDHLPGTSKRLDIASLAGRGCIRLARAEIEKCELVCANCHAVRTFMRREAKKAA
jgi:hypothetical protein